MRQIILNTIEPQLHGDGRERLLAPLTHSELEAAAKDLAHGTTQLNFTVSYDP